MKKIIMIVICSLLISSILPFSVGAVSSAYQTTVSTTPSDLTVTNYYGTSGKQTTSYPYYQINSSQVAYTCQLKYFTSQLDFVITLTNDYYDNGLSYDNESSSFLIDYIFKIPVGDISNFSSGTFSVIMADGDGVVWSESTGGTILDLGTVLNPGYETYRIAFPCMTSVFIEHSPLTITVSLDLSSALWNSARDSELIIEMPLEYVLSYSVEESNAIALATQSLIQNGIIPSVNNIATTATAIQQTLDSTNMTLEEIDTKLDSMPDDIVSSLETQIDEDVQTWQEDLAEKANGIVEFLTSENFPILSVTQYLPTLLEAFTTTDRLSVLTLPRGYIPALGDTEEIELWEEQTIDLDEATQQMNPTLITVSRAVVSFGLLWATLHWLFDFADELMQWSSKETSRRENSIDG